MTKQPRKFEAVDAATVREPKPLLIGITSPSFGGKTYSALRLAAGLQRVLKGKTKLVDTEAGRSLQYQDLFPFQYVKFAPPHSPEAYEQALDFCVADNETTVVIFDSMTHEHSGDGGVLDQIDDYLQRKGGDDFDKRERYKWAAQIEPKRQRKSLNTKIEQLGGRVVFIFCYRADDKIKPAPKGSVNKEPIHLGWTAETTSKLPYMMTVRFLLPPGSDGRPNLTPDTEFEKLSIKMPIQFRDWFKPGLQLNEDLGERLASWSIGQDTGVPKDEPRPAARAGRATAKPSGPSPCGDDECQDFLDGISVAPTFDDVKSLAAANRGRAWTAEQRGRINAAIEARRVAAISPQPPSEAAQASA
jgi:hypothetical protein